MYLIRAPLPIMINSDNRTNGTDYNIITMMLLLLIFIVIVVVVIIILTEEGEGCNNSYDKYGDDLMMIVIIRM